MSYLSPMLFNTRTLLLASIALACATSLAADVAPTNWKQGWDVNAIETYSRACTESFIADTDRARTSNKMAALTALELKRFRDAVQPMCRCLTVRLATTGSYADVQLNRTQRLQQLVGEANAGGQCSREVSEGFALLRSFLK
jgi:hypothetical protein